MESELLEDLIYWKTIVYDYLKNNLGNFYEYRTALNKINKIEMELEAVQ